ncbi:choloylglycine hydrolase family protein [Coprobacter sp. LH1063]|uniref:Choloylglycine hydrolase family protein n=1 Tax=Coprobacter tertius TaxID=2944915 RepID=A0ABT1ML74_9BACT|nr:choloylglycine hydrolase family protein [Coprobacter tertius]MCP9612443.1 choloylglycine hydrolase family protein [Coprobacter tertius]
MKKYLLSAIFLAGSIIKVSSCTGISLSPKDGSHILARTIEWGESVLPSEYVVIPEGVSLTSYTPSGINGLNYHTVHNIIGLSVVQKEFIVEGLNDAGLSAGLFYFPRYGSYETYNPAKNERTLSDLQVVSWILSRFETIDEVKAALPEVCIVSIQKPGLSSTVHWRIADKTGRQVVLEIENGTPHFYENKIGVLTNSPGFPWQITNLNNYVNLYPGGTPAQNLSGITLTSFGAGSGFLGIPGDVTPPSRFVRAAFYKASAPQLDTAGETVLQCFHILNNFDIPIGIEHPVGKSPDIPSATQWTSVSDLSNLKIYYKTSYNNSIRCIDMKEIDFAKIKYQSHPLDRETVQPIERIKIE